MKPEDMKGLIATIFVFVFVFVFVVSASVELIVTFPECLSNLSKHVVSSNADVFFERLLGALCSQPDCRSFKIISHVFDSIEILS
jgi:hypothetical protein